LPANSTGQSLSFENINLLSTIQFRKIMALEMQDLMALKSMGSEGSMTPYEQYMVGYKQSKKPSGVAIAGLTVGSVAAAAGITAWIFGGVYANAKAREAKEAANTAKEVAIAKNDGLRDLVQTLAATVAAERAERIQGDVNITQSVSDTITGQQSASQSQATTVENSAYATAMNQIISDALTGRSSLNPTPVNIYSAPQPCSCPGCGCNG
jgi:hypothetical protein